MNRTCSYDTTFTYNLLTTFMRSPICVFAVLFCVMSVSVENSLQAQSIQIQSSKFQRPQPDDGPTLNVAPFSLLEILSVNDGRALSVEKVARVFQLLACQINELEKELGAINPKAKHKANCKPPRALAKDMRLAPADDGVYAGKFYPPGRND